MKSFARLNGIQSSSFAVLLSISQTLSFSLLPATAADNQVRIAGSTVFAIAGQSPANSERAEKIQHNIDNSLVASSSHGPDAVKITYVKGLPVISLGGFYVSTVDNATAKAAGTTPTLLAQKWATGMKKALSDKSSTDAYIAQLTGAGASASESSPSTDAYQSNADTVAYDYNASAGTTIDATSAPPVAPALSTGWQSMAANNSYSPPAASQASYPASNYSQASPAYASYPPASTYQASAYQNTPYQNTPYQGRVSYMPAGMQIPVTLASSLSSQVAKAGDLVMAKTTENVYLENGMIPANSTLIGQVVDAADGAWLARSGKISIKFNTLRTPSGAETPITAHITGSIGKYDDKGNDTFRGENAGSKVKKTMLATAIGAGSGSALGVAVGAIAGGGRGVGKGAWSGAAIGAGLGLAQGLLVRKGAEVNLTQGQRFNLQLDAPVTVAMN